MTDGRRCRVFYDGSWTIRNFVLFLCLLLSCHSDYGRVESKTSVMFIDIRVTPNCAVGCSNEFGMSCVFGP